MGTIPGLIVLIFIWILKSKKEGLQTISLKQAGIICLWNIFIYILSVIVILIKLSDKN